RAMRFAREQLASWLQQGLLSAPDRQTLESYYDNQITGLEAGLDPGEAQLRPASACWDCKRPIALQQDYCRECGAPVKGENVTRPLLPGVRLPRGQETRQDRPSAPGHRPRHPG